MFAIETNIFALGHLESPVPAADSSQEIHDALNSARVFLADAKKFALLSIYEQRIHRNLQKSLAQLNDLQTTRRQQAPAAPVKPQPNVVNTLPDPPAENGFGFANDPIHPAIAAEPVRNPTESLKISTALRRHTMKECSAAVAQTRPVLRVFPTEPKGLLASLRPIMEANVESGNCQAR